MVNLFYGHIRTFKTVIKKGSNSPNEIELTENSFVGGKNQNMGFGSPCRNLKSSISAIGQCADGFGLNVIGDMYCVIAYGFSDESNGFDIRRFLRNRNKI